MCITKGADALIIPRLASGQDEIIAKTQQLLTDYSSDGLRTLIIAQKEIDKETYKKWKKDYNLALVSVFDREKKVEAEGEKIEKNLMIVGTTAIEDKL